MRYFYPMDTGIYRHIDNLVTYALARNLLPGEEAIYATNLLLDQLHLDSYDGLFFRDPEIRRLSIEDPGQTLKQILGNLVSYAVSNGVVEDILPLKDVFDAKLMNTLTPRPKTVIDRFWADYKKSPEKATLEYFEFSQDTDYIRRYRLSQDLYWEGWTKYGNLQILISLSKPELDPKAIAAAGKAKATGYPKCALCMENEGYAGRVDFAARSNHRIIPLKLCSEDFSLQFSPYRYCHQHCIVLNHRHIPMIINESALDKLLQFVEMFPHYFLGSNADLPYVGGSVLSHEHFQGGVHRLPIMDAKVMKTYISRPELEVSTLFWPLSTIRVKGKDRREVLAQASRILRAWRDGYADPDSSIDPGSADDQHNTVTPLACREGSDFVMFLMLRNNKRTEERPVGMFHTHQDRFHIKKEGIGIIDAPGLAILPSRLKKELAVVKEVLLGKESMADHPEISKHSDWMAHLIEKHKIFHADTVDAILRDEVVQVFMLMLEDCGVFKHTPSGEESFDRFVRFALGDNT